MQHVEARLPRARNAEDAVDVGLIVIGKRADRVRCVDKIADIGIKKACVLRVCNENRGRARGKDALHRLEVGISVLIRHEGDDLVARGRGRGCVARVGEHGGDDLIARRVAPLGVICARHARARVARGRAAARLEGKCVQTGNFLQKRLCLIVNLENALQRALRLERMHRRDIGVSRGDMLLHPGAVLHRAGALADIRRRVGAERLLRQAQKMAINAHLVHLGQLGRLFAAQLRRDRVASAPDGSGHLLVRLRHENTALARNAQIKNQLFVPPRLMIVAKKGVVIAPHLICPPLRSLPARRRARRSPLCR